MIDPLLPPWGVVAACAYLLALMAIGYAGRRARRDAGLSDFYLGGRTFGSVVLFFTLYATQYSGVTLVGFAGKAYRQGFSTLVTVAFGCAVFGSYLIIAPRLHRLATEHRYVTPGDYLQDRFRSHSLTVLATAVFVFALSAYIVTNLRAIGYVVVAATGGAITMAPAVILMAIWMVAYEILGGLRAVAWTDVLQGALLFAGFVVVFGSVWFHYGGLQASAEWLVAHRPNMLEAPSADGVRSWLSMLILVGTGVAIYPHAIQRFYAAKDSKALRTAVQWMLLMPFVFTLPIVFLAIIGAAQFPSLTIEQSEEVILLLVSKLVHQVPVLSFVIVLLLCAIVAAIMSTVDSALLSLSSLVARDLVGVRRPNLDERTLTVIGKATSGLLMALMVAGALGLPQTLWRITEIKLEVLCQAAPAFFLGLHLPRLNAFDVGCGLVAGLVTTCVLVTLGELGGTDLAKPFGVHAGTYGLGLNVVTVLASAWIRERADAAQQRARDTRRA